MPDSPAELRVRFNKKVWSSAASLACQLPSWPRNIQPSRALKPAPKGTGANTLTIEKVLQQQLNAKS